MRQRWPASGRSCRPPPYSASSALHAARYARPGDDSPHPTRPAALVHLRRCQKKWSRRHVSMRGTVRAGLAQESSSSYVPELGPVTQQGLDQRIHVLFAVVEMKCRAQIVVPEGRDDILLRQLAEELRNLLRPDTHHRPP